MKRLYSFVRKFLTKRGFCDANANQTQQPLRNLRPQDIQGRVFQGLRAPAPCPRTRRWPSTRSCLCLSRRTRHSGAWTELASICPDPSLSIYLYVRKEAVLSSQIEGTQSSFSDLMLFESAEAPSVSGRDPCGVTPSGGRSGETSYWTQMDRSCGVAQRPN